MSMGGGYQNVNKIAVNAIIEGTSIKQFNRHVINLKLVLLAAIVAFFVHF
jgi:hypothetical protein